MQLREGPLTALLCCQGGCWGADNYQDFSLARQLRISEASTRRLVKPRVWRVYRKYDYFAEFFDMVGRSELVLNSANY